MNILITGAGSVMGQSIYKAIAMHNFGEPIKIHFANSDEQGAGRFFSDPSAPVIATPIFPLAVDDHYEAFVIDYVRNNKIDIIFSGTQHELTKLSQIRDLTLNAATIPSHIAEICMDKVKTANVLLKYGIRTPITCDLSEYLNRNTQIEGSIIIKPNHSSSSRNIFKAAHAEEVQKLVDEGKINPDNFLVQELLIGEEYTCGCYIDRYSEQLNHITFKRTLTADGATFYGEIVNDPDIAAYVELIGRALIAEGLDFGHINVQLILTEFGPILFEINGRLSSTEASKAHYGFNSCAAFIYNIVKNTSYSHFQTQKCGRFLRYYEEVYFD